MTERRNFNPWLIVLGVVGCNGLLIMLANMDGYYLAPVMEEFGWSRTAASLYMTVYAWVAALIQPIVGKLFDKYDMRKIMSVVILLFGANYVISSTFTQLWQWTIFGIVYGICAGFFMYLPLPLLINRWFVKKTGFAMSLSGVICGVAGLIVNPLCQKLIDAQGWGHSRFVMGLVICGASLVLTILFVRNSPKESGSLPYGTGEEEKGQEQEKAGTLNGLTLAQARKTPVLYLGLLFTFLTCLACCFVQQVSSYANAFPVGALAGAFALSVFNGIGIPRGPVMGWFIDKCGSKMGNLVSCLVSALGMVLILAGGGKSPLLLYVGIACFSFLFVPLTMGIPLMVGDVFGSQDYAKIYSWMTTSQLVAGGVGPLIYGQLYDRTGNYGVFPIFVLVTCLVLMAMIPVIYGLGKKELH